jgi:hypothetical protein
LLPAAAAATATADVATSVAMAIFSPLHATNLLASWLLELR